MESRTRRSVSLPESHHCFVTAHGGFRKCPAPIDPRSTGLERWRSSQRNPHRSLRPDLLGSGVILGALDHIFCNYGIRRLLRPSTTTQLSLWRFHERFSFKIGGRRSISSSHSVHAYDQVVLMSSDRYHPQGASIRAKPRGRRKIQYLSAEAFKHDYAGTSVAPRSTFTHSWPLKGVEAQFYVFFPLILCLQFCECLRIAFARCSFDNRCICHGRASRSFGSNLTGANERIEEVGPGLHHEESQDGAPGMPDENDLVLMQPLLQQL